MRPTRLARIKGRAPGIAASASFPPGTRGGGFLLSTTEAPVKRDILLDERTFFRPRCAAPHSAVRSVPARSRVMQVILRAWRETTPPPAVELGRQSASAQITAETAA